MVVWTVKRKVRISNILVASAAVTLAVAMTGIASPRLVEYAYSRSVFPTISHIAGRFADFLPFSWLDIFVVVAVAFLVYVLWKRRWRHLVTAAAAAYLVFFWGWGLNYHREKIETKLALDSQRATPEEIEKFTRLAASELN